MDFSFINELSKQLEGLNIFNYTFTGAKVLALAFLLFRILESYMKDFDELKPKVGNVLSIMGYGLVIMSSDWIIVGIENLFAGVDTSMGKTESNLYTELWEIISQKDNELYEGAEDAFDYLTAFFSSMGVAIFHLIGYIVCMFLKLADLSITASFLLQRIFILKLLQFIFPLSVALSTYKGTEKLFHTWILRYFGIFILGIAYIGIIQFTSLVQSSLMGQYDNDFGGVVMGMLVALVVTFGIKVKLFTVVTNYIQNMFA